MSGDNSTASAQRRVTIHFQDDEVRRQSEATVLHLLAAAANGAHGNDKNTEMAKKALKYRNILERLAGVDVTSPDFDASKFLGVEWRKIESLKEYCAARESQAEADSPDEERDT